MRVAFFIKTAVFLCLLVSGELMNLDAVPLPAKGAQDDPAAKSHSAASQPESEQDVHEGKRITFTGRISLLTHDASFSGADALAMVMADLPHVTIIGEATNGIFSNMLESKLPNGWKYTLSFQVYYSAAMICYESKGVPVDITCS